MNQRLTSQSLLGRRLSEISVNSRLRVDSFLQISHQGLIDTHCTSQSTIKCQSRCQLCVGLVSSETDKCEDIDQLWKAITFLCGLFIVILCGFFNMCCSYYIMLCGFFIMCCSYYIMLCGFFIMCCSHFISFCGFFFMCCNVVLM